MDDIAGHLKTGRVLYTKARRTRFTAHVAGGALVVESDRSGRKVFSPAVVEAAAAAIVAGSPPVDDRAVQVARSWVGAIQDSMRGEPNGAPRTTPAPSAPASRARASKRTAKAPTSRKATASTAISRNPRRSMRAPRSAGRSAAVVRHPTDAGEIAREIGLEIARAIAAGQRPAAEQIETVVLAQIREQVAAANDELDRVKVELVAAEARAVTAERHAAAWKSAATSIPGIGTVAVAPGPAAHQEPPGRDVQALLREAARSWKSTPSGSVAASRSALEQTINVVAQRLPNGRAGVGNRFADVVRFLFDNVGATGNIAEADLHLARSLYSRSSKAGHAEAGWRATPTEALLVLAGVATVASRAKVLE